MSIFGGRPARRRGRRNRAPGGTVIPCRYTRPRRPARAGVVATDEAPTRPARPGHRRRDPGPGCLQSAGVRGDRAAGAERRRGLPASHGHPDGNRIGPPADARRLAAGRRRHDDTDRSADPHADPGPAVAHGHRYPVAPDGNPRSTDGDAHTGANGHAAASTPASTTPATSTCTCTCTASAATASAPGAGTRATAPPTPAARASARTCARPCTDRPRDRRGSR